VGGGGRRFKPLPLRWGGEGKVGGRIRNDRICSGILCRVCLGKGKKGKEGDEQSNSARLEKRERKRKLRKTRRWFAKGG